jgi:minor extracellular serine protease Vpr
LKEFMQKRLLTALLGLVLLNTGYARFFRDQDTRSFVIVLQEPSLSRMAFDDKGQSLYKGMATRQRHGHKRVRQRRRRLAENLGRFEDRLRHLSPKVRTRRRFTGLLNGLSLDMPADMAAQVQSMPEVLAIVPNRRYHALLTESNRLMNVPLVWERLGGDARAGGGIKIGIIDTGIDHTHDMFDDQGYAFPEGFPLGDTDFTNRKVIVARVFAKTGDAAQDSTARDRDGHGTHVASCAAGNLDTVSPLGLISGVAPNAYLGNYKVFTDDFTTLDQIVGALEACVEDGMDVVNLSLGSERYVNVLLDPEAIALRNAIKAGVVVVAAAGNAGDPETIGSPGQIPEVITVGSVTNAHTGTNAPLALMNVYADGRLIVRSESVVLATDLDFFAHPPLGRFQLVDADTLDRGSFGGAEDGRVCEALPAGSATNKWVLIHRGVCTFTDKINHVQAAGAWGALVYNHALADEGPDQPLLFPSVPGTQIPSFFTSHNRGLLVKDALQNADLVEIEFSPNPPTEDEQRPFQLSAFSSRGPSLSFAIKPEILAIGEGCYAATQKDLPGEFMFRSVELTGFELSGFNFSNGTSFSSPRVAGAAALLKQMHPTWSPADIKSALITSAERPSSLGSLSSMERGAGHINLIRAQDVPVCVTPASLSWGKVLIDDVRDVEKTVHLSNVSDRIQSMALSFQTSGAQRMSPVEVFPQQLELAPSESADVRITLKLNPPSQVGEVRDINGDVVIDIAGRSEALRVPAWARATRAPAAQGQILLIDDDEGDSLEDQYLIAIELAGYELTRWDVSRQGSYPTEQYMQDFPVVVWFMALTSLNMTGDDSVLPLNRRTQFNVELTRYLTRGGRLFVSGMDWSDQQEHSSFGQQVLHIRRFNRDPFVTFSGTGQLLSQETELAISRASNGLIGQGLARVSAKFDAGVPNLTDTLVLDQSGIARPAIITQQDQAKVIGITVETDSYRVVFLAFPLERVSARGMDTLMQNSLSWLLEGPRTRLTLDTIDPAVQHDSSLDLPVTLSVEGINFLVGHDIFLNDMPVKMTGIDLDGMVDILVPAGLPQGLYDISVHSPDGQRTTLLEAFQVE